ncbi:MAG TPA: membrane dipeptidase [Ktedonobacterales bacterium]
MFIVDGHEDIAHNALRYGRDVRRSVAQTREIEASQRRSRESAQSAGGSSSVSGSSAAPRRESTLETATIGLPEWRTGDVGLVFATIFTLPAPAPAQTEDGVKQLVYYHDLARENSGIRIVRTPAELDALVTDWTAAPILTERPVGFVLLVEGADSISKPSELYEWFNGGVRIVGLAWRGTRYSGGTGAPGPLTPAGRALLSEMERLGVLLDVSHLAEESFFQALDHFAGRVLASHSNVRSITPTDRQLSDDMIRAIAARDGVIGTVLANPFLNPAARAQPATRVTLADVVRHIDAICQLTGSARHCAIGSDFDGGFGVESTPEELDSIGDLGKIATALSHAGYTADDITAIMGGNWLRLLREALPSDTQAARP